MHVLRPPASGGGDGRSVSVSPAGEESARAVLRLTAVLECRESCEASATCWRSVSGLSSVKEEKGRESLPLSGPSGWWEREKRKKPR